MTNDSATERTPAVTATSVDPDYNDPVIEIDEMRESPVPHRYVHGSFRGTQARFSFYFPPEEQYEGRFFHNTYPMAITSDIGPFPIEFEVATGDLGFTVDSGAYYVQTNNGGLFRAAGVDPAIAAYRVNAAAAKFSRQVAADVYGEHRPWGYLFGGSGGAYQTLGAAENTEGVWDGFVPFVPGCDQAIPSMFTVRMHALRVLRQRDRLPGIADALAPGGSGDPYADLNEEEAAALREVSLMGFPPRSWYDHASMGSGYFANISGMIPAMDPGYVDDFWSEPGYLGTDSSSRIGEMRFRHESLVTATSGAPPFVIELADAPTGDCADAHLVVLSGESAGHSLPVKNAKGAAIELIMTADPAAAGKIAVGDRVAVDNSWALALQTYHRHQVPPPRNYYAWDQFLDSDGQALYPQRNVLVGPAGTINSAGSMLEGKFSGKMLMLAVLLDIDAFPWQADWYRSQAMASKGAAFEENFALYFIDNAHHENPQTALQRAHAVSFGGALQQALRDLSLWVEQGIEPSSTAYRIENTQVVVPADAAARKGIQPVVQLGVGITADGEFSERVEVSAGETVCFSAAVAVPPGMGSVVSAEWDFAGSGEFTQREDIPSPMETARFTASFTYHEAGTYFPALRVAAQRSGDSATAYGRVQNIALARVVVS